MALLENQKIEQATAEGFIALYNLAYGSSYIVKHVATHGEVPDVFSEDSSGRQFNMEVTLAEDRPGDIKAALGRSEHKSLAALKAHLKLVREGKELLNFNSLNGNVLENLTTCILKKLNKNYGENVALIIRETGLPWDWSDVIPNVQASLSCKTIPFDKGIWLLSFCKSKITCLYSEHDFQRDHSKSSLKRS